ncbi:cell-cycle regulation histidine triad protein [Alkalihalophilus pseudofirmus OF4]|uniref:Cell-cycle regulation histidine triad protein n=1 Tax=Alkalihalophilus pseudofirmus (strain ATCC BAA-2126 / JCM 17055 / OF4) TaxID=398511 RepID=D3FQV2_ALKPO|nr:HIT family protein [Alkalihalophilus pseudofirmus]ADC51472.1 cell-cycle regulation histidine triad protein [Alkalihalophilus pseudofirmus OF4]
MQNNQCPFCTIKDYLFENKHAYAIYDRYPVTEGHILIIPKRHVADYFEATSTEQAALFELVHTARAFLNDTYSPDGFNIGMNCGEAAGQTIFHAHIHVIPRYNGDMENPRGGVRGVIPAKQSY